MELLQIIKFLPTVKILFMESIILTKPPHLVLPMQCLIWILTEVNHKTQDGQVLYIPITDNATHP